MNVLIFLLLKLIVQLKKKEFSSLKCKFVYRKGNGEWRGRYEHVWWWKRICWISLHRGYCGSSHPWDTWEVPENNEFYRVDILHKVRGDVRIFWREKSLYFVWNMPEEIMSIVVNLHSRTECGIRKHFQKIPVFKGLQFCTDRIQERTLLKCRVKSSLQLNFLFHENLPF